MIPLMPLGHHGSEGLHLRLELAVLLSKLRGCTYTILHLVRCGVSLLLSYDALLVSLAMFTNTMLTLMVDGSKLRLELP
jgi:hypothetical protein